MSKKKMCPFIDMVGCPGDTQDSCPKNTNSKCEIIPKKPKMVRVKAWANMDEDSGCDIITAVNVLPKYFSGAYSVPCTILIDEKHLRRKP